MMRFIKRFRTDIAGVSAIEFAFVLWPMVITLFGVSEIANYILAARKVSNIASSAADLVTQDTVITDVEMDDIMGALDVILRPFDPTEAKIVISHVVADNNGNTTVDWSDARNAPPRAEGSPVTVPDDIVPDNQGIIMTEVSFTYKTLFGMFLTDGLTVSDKFYLKPRRSTTIDRQ
ncbi:MAG: pilus assembly protein [Alphaproteobacteria bacterium]|nr:pilus assembly protein [Alphaproteobacteria bacterium]